LTWGLLASVAGYAIMRAFQAVFVVQPDPSRVAWSVHAGFFWRALTVSYAGGIATFIGGAVTSANLHASARRLPVAVAIASGLVAAQTLFFP
jgi:hypothetical protein